MLRALKITVSATLIAILVWNVDWPNFLSDFRNMDPVLVIVAFILLWVQYPLSAWKWQKSLELHGLAYPFGRLLRILCIAFFFNNFLPTAIGGDAYRAYRTMGKAKRRAHAVSAVVVERLVGIASLVFLGYVSAIYLVFNGDLLHRRSVVGAVMLATAGVFFTWLAWKSGSHEKIWSRLKSVKKLEPLIDSVRVMRRNQQHFVGLIGLSMFNQGLAIFTTALLFAALKLPGNLFESGFTMAAAGVAGVLPLSINGIGIVESSFVVAAMETSLPYTQAVLVALFLRAFMIVASILFGLLYAAEPAEDRMVQKDAVN